MALSIKTDEADRLARDLARLTGESMTTAVTVALRERLERERQVRREPDGEPLEAFLDRIRPLFEQRPVSAAEWANAGSDDWDDIVARKR